MTNFRHLLLIGALALPLPMLTGCGDQAEKSEALSHIARSDTYVEQGQYRPALLEIKNAIQKEPNNVNHLVQLASLYLELGAAREASDLLEPWLEDQTQAVALTLAQAYLARGKHLSAVETLDRIEPESEAAELEHELVRAEALRQSGKPRQALAGFQAVHERSSDNREALIGILRSRIDLGDANQAVATADNALDPQNPDPELLFLKGLALYKQGQVESAIEVLTEATGALPSVDVFLPVRRDLLTLLSQALTQQGRITEAQLYNRILAENTDTDARERAKAAVSAIQSGNLEEARVTLQDMLQLDPENEQAALMLGALNLQLGDLSEGAGLLADNLDPETSPTPFIRAATLAQVEQGQRKDALANLSRAIEARPNDPDLLAMHGVLALSLPGRADEGVASISKALGLNPQMTRLNLALARHHLSEGQPQQALGQLRMAFANNPSDWPTTSSYVGELLRQDELGEAREIRDSLLNGYPDSPQAILMASLVDAGLENNERALARLKELTTKQANYQPGLIALANLQTKLERTEAAAETMIKAAKLTPQNLEPLRQAGRLYAMTHSMEEVAEWLKSQTGDDPELSNSGAALIAMVQVRQGELDAAANTLAGIDADTASEPVKHAKARLLVAQAEGLIGDKNWADAQANATQAIALQPAHLGFALLPARLYQLEGKQQEAMAQLDEVEERFGTRPEIVVSRASLLQQMDRADEAYRYLEEQWQASEDQRMLPALISLAETQDPDRVDELTQTWAGQAPGNLQAQMKRANYLMQQGNDAAAARHYQEVLDRQPNNILALNNLAWLLRESSPARALELAQRASELAPDNPAVLDTYGWVLHLQGKHQEAMAAIEKALAAAPQSEEIADHLEQVKQAL
ncbi:tetratricopeptide repeat protein [Marinobacter sp. CA1]|uniref:tetratricopeptide repeat protein n=1 Tax=Marinobacter sp. CA1 TaxID=2817656 RepID=UPI001D064F85|nr:tetratricopeptide repeat protein [Marinobacter sp. CA1]UDL03313.1 tetratricopeptide repeat protein [Marinobacter sp. CA1]